MTEEEWLKEKDPTAMLAFLRGKVTERKLRLAACAFGLSAWDMQPNRRVHRILELVERYADELATEGELATVHQIALEGATSQRTSAYHSAYRALADASDLGTAVLFDTPRVSELSALDSFWPWDWWRYGRRIRKLNIRWVWCIFGNPFRPVALDPSWLTTTVLALANGIYADKAFDRMPILADALQDEGCDNEDILNHCRQPGEHVRGCWVVDLLLGKQ